MVRLTRTITFQNLLPRPPTENATCCCMHPHSPSNSDWLEGLVWWLVGTTVGQPRAVPKVYPIKQISADTGLTLWRLYLSVVPIATDSALPSPNKWFRAADGARTATNEFLNCFRIFSLVLIYNTAQSPKTRYYVLFLADDVKTLILEHDDGTLL